jgi:hypothetical protein
MAGIPQYFPETAGGAVASYDYTDLAEGTGITSFYAATVSGAQILTKKQIYSNFIDTNKASNNAGYTKLIDYDFDLTSFNLPKVVKGTAYINIPFAVQSSAGSVTTTAWVRAIVRHWDGTTETDLGQASGSVMISPASAGGVKQMVDALKISLTEKNFKAGETLRLTVEGWALGAPNGSSDLSIGHDPQNRKGTILDTASGSAPVTTSLIANIPFKLDP